MQEPFLYQRFQLYMEQFVDKSVDIKNKTKVKRLPPLVLPLSEDNDFNSPEFKARLKYFTATSNGFKWKDTNITSKKKKFLPRNGFNTLFWSAMIVDNTIIPFILDLFEDNITYISDEEFKPTFGMRLKKSSDISNLQLFVNYFLMFALPAKSHNQYLQEWVKRRLIGFNKNLSEDRLLDIEDINGYKFDSHPELFLETKRRFYLYKDLVPALTLYAVESCYKRTDFIKHLFQQIRLEMKYSGLQTFYMSWFYSNSEDVIEIFDLEALKDDKQRITFARNVIVEKYGENALPFARLLNLPEVEDLDRRHYPDLAFCSHYSRLRDCKLLGKEWMNNFMFRDIQTKTPTDELIKLIEKINKPIGYTMMEKLMIHLGLLKQ